MTLVWVVDMCIVAGLGGSSLCLVGAQGGSGLGGRRVCCGWLYTLCMFVLAVSPFISLLPVTAPST